MAKVAVTRSVPSLKDLSIWKSGRVPPVLEFDPCEPLRMYQRHPGENADPLGLAFCRTLLCVSPSTYGDTPPDFAVPLVESCLALGGEAPVLAERLMAWLAVSEPSDVVGLHDEHGCPDPVALLALALLRTAADPDDVRLPSVVRAVTDAVTRPDTLPWHLRDRADLARSLLAPRRSTSPDIERLLAALLRDEPAADS